MSRTINILLNQREVDLLIKALEDAKDSHHEYVRHGNPEEDYEGDPDGYEEMKRYPEELAALDEKITKAYYGDPCYM